MKILMISFLIFLWRFHLPVQLPHQTQQLTGTIASIAEQHHKNIEFIFNTDKTHQKLWVSWFYAPPVTLRIGDRWEFKLSINPTTKNWLLAQQMNGMASVQMDYKNQLLERHPWRYPLAHIREKLYQQLKRSLDNNPVSGFIAALSLGQRDLITQDQWDDMRATGTNHLMAIAGLHIGFIASMTYAFFLFFIKRFPTILLHKPAQEIAMVFSLMAAFFYSALAGFSLPTQRAIIMLSVFLYAKLTRRQLGAWSSYLIAISIVIVVNPLSVLTPSFYLSFFSVGLLIYSMSNRLDMKNWWWHWGRAQWVMAIGLLPLSLLFFQQVSLIGFFANVIAIPFIGFIILPLCLLGDISSCGIFWKIAAFLLNYFWKHIHSLAQLPHHAWQVAMPEHYLILTSTISVLLFLAPTGWPTRWLGFIWLLPTILINSYGY